MHIQEKYEKVQEIYLPSCHIKNSNHKIGFGGVGFGFRWRGAPGLLLVLMLARRQKFGFSIYTIFVCTWEIFKIYFYVHKAYVYVPFAVCLFSC